MGCLMHWWQKWSIGVLCVSVCVCVVCVLAGESLSSICFRLSVWNAAVTQSPSVCSHKRWMALELHSFLCQRRYHCCEWGMWEGHCNGGGLARHDSSLPVSASGSVYLSQSPLRALSWWGQCGLVIWQTCGCVIIISLTTACQRDITSESV